MRFRSSGLTIAGIAALLAFAPQGLTSRAEAQAAGAQALRAGVSSQTKLAALKPVATFPHEVTGVAVAGDGRVFVNFPRWTEDSPISLAEVRSDGTLAPYPDAGWNAWRNARQDDITPNDHWVCVQSVVADRRAISGSSILARRHSGRS